MRQNAVALLASASAVAREDFIVKAMSSNRCKQCYTDTDASMRQPVPINDIECDTRSCRMKYVA